MQDEPSQFAFAEKFPNEQACIDFLEKSRWPEGVKSPFTGGDAYHITTRPGLFKCKDCGQNFTVRHGTIFEESRLPLRKWFHAIFLLHSFNKSISSVQLSKYLGITQKSAWFMLQRIRYATEHQLFKAPLTGVAEIDETYFGGHRPDPRGPGSGKPPCCFSRLTCEKLISKPTL